MRAARNQRGKFRLTVMEMVRKSRELGIGSEVPVTIIAERVEMLLHRNRFLDAPYTVSPSHQHPLAITNVLIN